MQGGGEDKKAPESAAYERLRWRVLRAFGALPSEERVKAMGEEDYLWCAYHLVLDGEETLSRLCPSCRQRVEEERCPVCGAAAEDQGVNAGFDMEQFERLGGTGEAGQAEPVTRQARTVREQAEAVNERAKTVTRQAETAAQWAQAAAQSEQGAFSALLAQDREQMAGELLVALNRVRAGETGLSFLRQARQTEEGIQLAGAADRALTVLLPELPAAASGWTAEELDRAVERDARRYDGPSPLY